MTQYISYRQSSYTFNETVVLMNKVYDDIKTIISSDLRINFKDIISKLEIKNINVKDIDKEITLKTIRGLRTNKNSFSDDGIKSIKYLVWESIFEKKLATLRKKEAMK